MCIRDRSGTQGTADTAGLAGCLYILALVVAAALYQMLCAVRHKLDQSLWTGSHTFTAGHTFFLVNHCHAVNHVDGIKLTGLYTGAKSHTAVAAGLGAASGNNGGFGAVLDSCIGVQGFCLIAGSLAAYKGYLLICSPCVYTQDGSDLLSYGSAAYGTGICGSLTVCNGLCQSITACEAAAAAVVPAAAAVAAAVTFRNGDRISSRKFFRALILR